MDTNVKTIQMRCKICDGVMTVDENNSVMMCPYCGSKELIQESDDVIIERIKNEANKDIERSKLEYEERKEKRQEEKELSQKFKNGKLIKVIIAAFVISLITLILSFRQGMILAGLVALVQAVLFACALLMGLQIIKEKKPNLHIVAAILAFILIIPFLRHAVILKLKNLHMIGLLMVSAPCFLSLMLKKVKLPQIQIHLFICECIRFLKSSMKNT